MGQLMAKDPSMPEFLAGRPCASPFSYPLPADAAGTSSDGVCLHLGPAAACAIAAMCCCLTQAKALPMFPRSFARSRTCWITTMPRSSLILGDMVSLMAATGRCKANGMHQSVPGTTALKTVDISVRQKMPSNWHPVTHWCNSSWYVIAPLHCCTCRIQ